ncbi:hypothetical protein GYA49_03645 [Candidatus Beckwithbacteria bacterium]|nr:hypothetical protein [Candidatus Beckwithbacteria bacterium]
MELVFNINRFQFPYKGLKFPGQHSEERILFITREGRIVIKIKLALCVAVVLLGLVIGIAILNKLTILGFTFSRFIPIFAIFWLLAGAFMYWWLWVVWRKTLFIITTRRLTKFIHTSPWTRYQMSLGLDQVVDTGAYRKGLFQMVTGLGYFVARSAAGAVKNFKIINISFSEDLHNYINKLLFVFNEQKENLDKFRPFIPHLKGEARDEYVRQVAPEFSKAIKLPPEAEGEYLPKGKTIYEKKLELGEQDEN